MWSSFALPEKIRAAAGALERGLAGSGVPARGLTGSEAPARGLTGRQLSHVTLCEPVSLVRELTTPPGLSGSRGWLVHFMAVCICSVAGGRQDRAPQGPAFRMAQQFSLLQDLSTERPPQAPDGESPGNLKGSRRFRRLGGSGCWSVEGGAVCRGSTCNGSAPSTQASSQ